MHFFLSTFIENFAWIYLTYSVVIAQVIRQRNIWSPASSSQLYFGHWRFWKITSNPQDKFAWHKDIITHSIFVCQTPLTIDDNFQSQGEAYGVPDGNEPGE